MRKAMTVLTIVVALLGMSNMMFAQASAHVDATATASVNQHQVSKGQFEAQLGKAQSIHWNDTVNLVWRHADGKVFAEQNVHNLVTNAGFDLISKAVSDTATQPASCNFVAVTNTAITPAAGDTTLSGEIATNGLSRAAGTFSHTNGTQTYTVAKVFTASGTQASQATGLFNASSSGTMCYEATYTQVTVNSGDTLTVTWTVTLS